MPYTHSCDYEAQEIEKKYKPVKLKTNRNMWKLVILNILTLGIYSIVFFIPFSFDLDKVAPKADHSKTMNYVFAYILSLFTFSIVIDIWHYQTAVRVEEALERYDIDYKFSRWEFWLWFILGSFVLVGPFVYFHKLCRSMNLLCANYNEQTLSDKKS